MGKITLILCWWECKMLLPLWKTAWQLLKKLNMVATKWPSRFTPGHIPRPSNTYVHIKIYTRISVAAFKPKKWKQLTCPATEEWIKKMWSVHPVDSYLAIKKRMKFWCATTWMNLENFTLSEVSQMQKATDCDSIYTIHPG